MFRLPAEADRGTGEEGPEWRGGAGGAALGPAPRAAARLLEGYRGSLLRLDESSSIDLASGIGQVSTVRYWRDNGRFNEERCESQFRLVYEPREDQMGMTGQPLPKSDAAELHACGRQPSDTAIVVREEEPCDPHRMDDLLPDEEFDLVVAQLSDRMSEYIVALRQIPNVDAPLKVDLWNAAVRKRDEIDALNTRLAELESVIRARVLPEPTAGALTILTACRAVGWEVEAHNDARVVIGRCMEQVDSLKDPVARASGRDWLRRALAYAEGGRSGPAAMCVSNAKQLLSRC